MSKPILLRIPEDDLARIDAQAKIERNTRTGLFLRAMDEYLSRQAATLAAIAKNLENKDRRRKR